MPRLSALRNVLVIVGAYYVSAWVLIPLWIPIARLVGGRVYHSGWESFWMNMLNTIPLAVGAVLAGMTIGVLLETSRYLVWAVVTGGFVALCAWSSARWTALPPLADLAEQGARAVVVGGLAFAACWLVMRRRVAVAKPDASA